MKRKPKHPDGCPYCHGNGDCYGQCDERFKAQVSMILAPIRKLGKQIRAAMAASRKAHKAGQEGK